MSARSPGDELENYPVIPRGVRRGGKTLGSSSAVERGAVNASVAGRRRMTARRIFCFLFHWRRQRRDSDVHWYVWWCECCGERWRVARGAVGEAAPCATCQDDPEVCASVAGLRHCEKANRGEAAIKQETER